MNSAADTPNSAMKAGSNIDCDIAAANGSRRNSGSCNAAPLPPCGPNAGPSGIGGSFELILEVMKEAMPALPSTAPT